VTRRCGGLRRSYCSTIRRATIAFVRCTGTGSARTLRYVDDLILLADDPGTLRSWRESIAAVLRQRLGLVLRADGAEPMPVERGIDFVGWRTWWRHRVPRARTVAGLVERVRVFERAEVASILCGRAQRVAWREPAARVLRASLASFSGYLRHGAAARQWQGVWVQAPWLEACFVRTGW
jgi:hypothetical protein